MPISLLALAAVSFAAASPAAGADGLAGRGKELYSKSCASCHGPDGRGVTTQGAPTGAGNVRALGPSLRGVGALSTDFYLRTGYMPLRDARDQPHRRKPPFTDPQISAIVAYVASLGSGPAVPRPHPERGSLSRGLQLFTEHCAGCHQIAAVGGVVTGGLAPSLRHATPVQVAQAIRIGPYLMPSSSARQIDDRDLDSIVRYVESTKHPEDRGGWAIGHVGPVPEGLVTWLIAVVALVGVAVLVGKRARP